MLVMVNALTALSNAQSIPIHPEDAGKLAKNETSKSIVEESHHPVQVPVEVPFRTKEQKQIAHNRRLVHFVIHSALENELEDLLDIGFDETMLTHEDVADVQKCFGKPILNQFTHCLTNSEERQKTQNKPNHPAHVVEPSHLPGNHTEIPTKPVTEHKDSNELTDQEALGLYFHPDVVQFLKPNEAKRIHLCLEDQTFKIIEDNLDLIEDLEESDTDYSSLDEIEKLNELEELEEIEKLKELEELEEIHEHHHHKHHHGSSHHHHAHHDHHHHVLHHVHDNEAKELDLVESGFKPTKSTLPFDEHNPTQNTGKNHMVLEKRKFGYGPDWATLVGKRDVHPLP